MNPGTKLRALVVDDDPVHLQMATVFLGMAGYDVTTAQNGTAALAVLESTRFDIALVDVEMPVMGGLELLQIMGHRGILADMPTIVATSRDDIPIIDRAFELGASDFTVKPVNWGLMTHEMRFVMRAVENEKAAAAARDEALRLSALKDQLLSVVRHEFRTPLQSVLGFGRLVAHGAAVAGDATLAGNAAEMLKGGERLNEIVNDMMLHLDLEAGRLSASRETEAIATLLHDLEPLLSRRAAASGLAARIDDLSGGARIKVQASQIAEAVRRLIDNVEKHARAGQVILASRRLDDSSVGIEVADDGCGISEALHGVHARAFVQGDARLARNADGLGLGLSIVDGLTQLNGGRMELCRPANGGSVVRLIFPAA